MSLVSTCVSRAFTVTIKYELFLPPDVGKRSEVEQINLKLAAPPPLSTTLQKKDESIRITNTVVLSGNTAAKMDSRDGNHKNFGFFSQDF
jgi:hypothetical protein